MRTSAIVCFCSEVADPQKFLTKPIKFLTHGCWWFSSFGVPGLVSDEDHAATILDRTEHPAWGSDSIDMDDVSCPICACQGYDYALSSVLYDPAWHGGLVGANVDKSAFFLKDFFRDLILEVFLDPKP